MVFSAVSSTSYRRSISPAAEGQPRRDGHSGRLFTLQQREVANEDVADLAMQQATVIPKSPTSSEAALEKWLRLVGAARQMAYEDQPQAFQGTSDTMRYRLQRTYFDQERQVNPPLKNQPDPRLQAYYSAGRAEQAARVVDFVV